MQRLVSVLTLASLAQAITPELETTRQHTLPPKLSVPPSSYGGNGEDSVGIPAVGYKSLYFGIPIQDSAYAPFGQPWTVYNYYTYQAPLNQGFKVIVTQLTGDVDMFVGDPNIPVPTYNYFNWSAATSNAEIVEIPPSAVVCGSPSNCTFYIGVSPFSMGLSTYTITVTNVNGPIMLQDGVPVDGFVAQGDSDHYNITISPASTFHSLSIALSPGNGDPDVYVTLNDYSGHWPGPTNFQYSATGSSGDELLVINFRDTIYQKYCPPNNICNISISVYGWTSSFYTITATSAGGYAQLIAGVPLTGYVSANSYAYFNFTPPTANNFTVLVTSLSGDPDVYASATNIAPNKGIGNYTWSSTGAADEVIQITTTDPNYKAPPASYIFGVYGWGGNTSFTITARMDNNRNGTIQLLDGVPQAGIALAHSFAYFAFNVSGRFPIGGQPPGVDVAVIPQVGDADLYISNLTKIGPDGNPTFIYPQVICTYRSSSGTCLIYGVDPSTYTWSSRNAGVQDFVSIPPSQVFPGNGYIIGVLATTLDPPNGVADPTVFSVTASTGYTVTQLPTGTQVPGVVRPRGYKYYAYTVTAWGMDIVIAATIKSAGSLNIFVSENYRPSNGNSTWNSTSGGGIITDKFVYIPFNSLSERCQWAQFSGETCVLMIAVQGYVNMGVECFYTIAAQISGSQVYPYWLDPGSPIYTFVPAHAYEYFYTIVDIPPTQSIFLTVQNIVGSTTMYVNLGSNKNFWVAGGPPADAVSPDVGGFERIYVPPSSNIVPPKSQIQRAQHKLAAVLHLSKDEKTGYIDVASEDVDGMIDANNGARVIAQLGNNGAVIEVPLRITDEDVHQATSLRNAVKASISEYTLPSIPAGVPIMQNNQKVGELSPYSSAARRVRVDRWGKEADNMRTKLADAKEREQTARDAGTEMNPGHDLDRNLGQAVYCNSCEMYTTVAAGATDANILVSYFGGAAYMNLVDGVPQQAYSPPDGFQYFSYTATDPTLDLAIVVSQLFGQTEVYIIVQGPTTPQLMPMAYLYTWSFMPYMGVSQIYINHTDVNFCKPIDGSTPGVPCTYLIGVFGRNNESATYEVSVTSVSNGLVPLFDGVPVAGSVSEGNVQYYMFQACAPGYAVPAVYLAWTNIFGSVTAYITNQYIPGSSTNSLLPGPNSQACQWIGANYSGLPLEPGDPCYNPNAPLYTIAIVGTTGVPNAVSRYEITAVVAGDPSLLVYGLPTTNIFVPNTMNINFTFTVADNTQDIVISATPTYGEVGLLVAHDDPINNTVPNCYMPCGGCAVTCTGYTWFLPSFGSSPVLYIPAANPCNPIVPPGVPNVIVSPSCNASTSFRPGRYWAVLYGFGKMSEASLVVTQPSQPITLPDGQPQDTQTGVVTLCPTRDNVTGICTGSSNNWLTPQASFFTLRIPVSSASIDAYVILDRLCGNSTGFCGPQLMAYVSACRDSGPGSCDANAPFPSSLNNRFSVLVSDVQATLNMTYKLCGGFGTGDCLVYIGVYPVCGPPGLPQPGIGCSPTLFRATFTSNTGIERVPGDCFGSGSTCVLPEVMGQNGMIKRYEAYAGDFKTSLTITAQVCSGTVNAYYCDALNGNCNPVNIPGPSNFDQQAGADLHGNAQISTTITGGLFFLGIRPSSAAGFGSPTYQLTLQAGQGPLLVPSPLNPNIAVSRDSTGSLLTVAFDGVYITAPGQMSYRAPNAYYNIYAFPLGTTGQARLDTPCGVDDASSTTANVVTGFTTGTEATLSIVPTVTYVVTVVGTCPAGDCMPNSQMAQRAALYPANSIPIPVPSPSPSFAPAPNNVPASSGLSPGGAAGVAIVVILGLGVGGFFGYKRFFGGSGNSSSRYSSGGSSGVMDSLPDWIKPSYWMGNGNSYSGYTLTNDASMFTSSMDHDIQLQNEGQDATYTAL